MIILWPILALLVFHISIQVSPRLEFGFEYDEVFYTKLSLIVITHLAAFGLIPIALLLMRPVSKAQFIVLTVMGGLLACLQLIGRMFGNFSLQPGDNTVMPGHLNDTATIITAVVLVTTYGSFLYALRPKRVK